VDFDRFWTGAADLISMRRSLWIRIPRVRGTLFDCRHLTGSSLVAQSPMKWLMMSCADTSFP
jgi:hypothetical protein